MNPKNKLLGHFLHGEIDFFRCWLKDKKRKHIILPNKANHAVFLILMDKIVREGRVEAVKAVQAFCWFPPKGISVYFLYYGGVDRQYYMIKGRSGNQYFVHVDRNGPRQIEVTGLPAELWHKFRRVLAKAPIGVPMGE